MVPRAFAFVVAAAVFCVPSVAPGGEGAAHFVCVSPDGQGFTIGGKPWYPFGCNYFDPHVGWAPKLWQQFDADKVEGHFRVMRDLGVNVVRVFLTAQSFYREPPNVEPDALRKFDALLEIGRRHGIRVHPTGPDHWEGRPPWMRTDKYSDPQALEAQAAFWKAFAARYQDHPTIFAYDLLNEPEIGWQSESMEKGWRAWLRERYGSIDALRNAWGAEGEKMESFDAVPIPPNEAAPQSRALLDYQRFRESVADRWTKVQVDAIRSVDRNHLVTVGFIQWVVPVRRARPSHLAAFRPSRIAPMVDFLSVHFYPLWGDPLASQEEFDRNLAYLELVLRCVGAGDPGKPLVVGEFGWHGGGKPDGQAEYPAEDQARWCRAAVLQGRGIAAGWLNWAYADTPSSRDVTKFSGLVTDDGTPKPWGSAFRKLADSPDTWTSALPEPKDSVEFDMDRALVDPPFGDTFLERYYERWKAQRRCGVRAR